MRPGCLSSFKRSLSSPVQCHTNEQIMGNPVAPRQILDPVYKEEAKILCIALNHITC